MITVYYVNRPPQTFQTVEYNCQGGFFMIIQSFSGHQTTTCIPSSLIDRVTIDQGT